MRTTCNGFVGPATACRAASCAAGVGTLAATCSGKGGCQALVTVTCAPYACAAKACGTSCATDAGCDPKFRCDVNTHACIPLGAASCDGDHTLVAPDGKKTDCAPFRCAGASCNKTCNSILDCAYPSECSTTDHTCVAPLGADAAPASGGCALSSSEAGRGEGMASPLVGALGIVLWRRRRSSRASKTPSSAPPRR